MNDCSVTSPLDMVGDGAWQLAGDNGCDCDAEPLPKVDCTKFVEFLNNFVKLLVLNDNKPLDDDDDDDDDATAAAAFGDSASVALPPPRVDFVFWLNIILAFSLTLINHLKILETISDYIVFVVA